MNPALKTKALSLTIALVCGWLGGWALRNIAAPQANQPEFAASARSSDQEGVAEALPVSAEAPAAFFDRLHEALGIRDRAKRKRAIASLADDLDAVEIRQSLERIAVSHIPDRKEVMAQLFERWGELDALAAMAFVNELPKLSDRSGAVSAILNAWIENDPDAAEKWVTALPGGALKSAAWETIILAHAASDPARAIALTRRTNITWYSASKIGDAIFGSWAVQDPQTAAAHAFQLPEGPLRVQALETVAKQWGETDPQQAMRWAQSLPDRLVPERVHYEGKTTFSGADKTNTVREILAPWLKQDRAAVLEWLADLPNDPWKTAMISTACKYSVENLRDPELIVQIAGFLPRGETRDEMLAGGASHLAEGDPKAGLAMLSHETEKGARLTIMEGLAGNLMGDDLLTALREVQADGTAIGNLTSWADPETAARWALQQPESEKYLPKIAAAWLVKDPERAQDVVRTLPVPLRDEVLSNAALNFKGGNSREVTIQRFERAANWIPEISSLDVRQSTYRKLAEHWLRSEPGSGRRWIESAPLGAEVKSELLKAGSPKR